MTLASVQSALADLAGVEDRKPIDGWVIVVDNDSGDGSAEQIEDWIEANPEEPVELVRSAVNSGFSGGHNQGLAAMEAEFTLVLNSDAEIRPGCLGALLDAAETHPGFGLFAPRLEDEDGTPQISSFRDHSPLSELIRAAGTGQLTRMLKRFDVPTCTAPNPGRIDWSSFAAVLLRRKMVDEIGSLDEGYFLYFEDTDYCRTARKAGWGVMHVPEARVVHHRGGSGPVKGLEDARKRLPPYLYASRTRFFFKAYGWTGIVAANLMWHLGRGIAQSRRLFGKPVPPANEAEWRDIWTNVAHPSGPRRAPWEDR